MSGVAMAYGSAGLQAGAGGLRQSAGVADAAVSALAAAPLEPVMFGLTPAAPAFAAALAAVRDAQARGFQQESGRATDLAGRADGVAGAGQNLVGRTTKVAGSVPVTGSR